MTKSVFAVISAAVALGLSAHAGLSCSCSYLVERGTPLLANGDPVPSPLELSDQPFLFMGTVLSQVPVPQGLPAPEYGTPVETMATFLVEGSWRGAAYFSRIRLYTGFAGGACGFRFEPNTCYLVFARVRDDGLLYTDICTRTVRYSQATELLYFVEAFLGPPIISDGSTYPSASP